jgi:hypothetical protein
MQPVYAYLSSLKASSGFAATSGFEGITMIKKVLIVSGLCFVSLLSASDPEAALKNSIDNFKNLVDGILKTSTTSTIDPSLSKIRSNYAYDIGKKLDDALFDKPLGGEQYLSYCRQIRDLNERLNLWISQHKNA